MARYIDADALIKELSTMYKEPTSTEDFMTVGYDKAIADVVVTAHRHPAADVRENVKATWCFTPDGSLICSACYLNPTNRIIIDGDTVYDMTPIRRYMKFCPNCGAEMVKGEEDGRSDKQTKC